MRHFTQALVTTLAALSLGSTAQAQEMPSRCTISCNRTPTPTPSSSSPGASASRRSRTSA